MADIFKFGGFIKNNLKKREEATGLAEPVAEPEEGSQSATQSGTAKPTMTQAEFSYGSEGMRRKRRE
jgi:hypothetical protein